MSLSGLPDDELVQRVRVGDRRSYAELWVRHSAAAHAAARAFSTLDADDLVAEAYARILAAIGRGSGPTIGFRPYLLTSVRNVAREWGARAARAQATDLENTVQAAAPDAENDALHALEKGATATAFHTLPTRWQEALWYAEIDGMKPRQFAPLLGLAPNAASALLLRARRGFRDAWIGTQLRRATEPECIEAMSLLGSHTRGALSRRDARRVDAHLATCTGCALAWEEAKDVASRLALVMLPLTVGIGGAAAYTAWAQTGGAQAAAAATVGGSVPPSGGVLTRMSSRPARLAAVATAAVVAVAIAGGAWAWLAPIGTNALTSSAAADSAARTPVDPSTPAPSDIEAPVAESTMPEAAASETTRPPTTAPAESETTETVTAASAADDAPTPDDPPVDDDPVPVVLPAPTIVVDASAGTLVYPELSGTDATHGATITLTDADGTVWASTVADDTGSWQVDEFSGNACATDASAYLPSGTHFFTATQTVADATSAASAAVSFTVAAPPTIIAPASGESVSQNGFALVLSGEAGTSVQRIKLPDASPCRPGLMELQADGSFNNVFVVPQTGPITIGTRYVDPTTGRHGPASFVTFTAF